MHGFLGIINSSKFLILPLDKFVKAFGADEVYLQKTFVGTKEII